MCTETFSSTQKIMENGRIHLHHAPHSSVEVQRSMKIVVMGGKEVGLVGGIMIDPQHDNVTHILLCHLPVTAVYRLIPISLIAKVTAETVHLT
ncbi:MAG: hypothetical protein GY943_09960, partial [Chloroflexi bacterium]|nr:hypothetical protein [Chloroflexota bacterium]